MSTTAVLTIMLVVSWLLIFFGIFLYERLDRRTAVLKVQQDYLIGIQTAIMQHLGVEWTEQPLQEQMLALLQSGKTYEAITLYRSTQGVSYKEAKAYVDHLLQPSGQP